MSYSFDRIVLIFGYIVERTNTCTQPLHCRVHGSCTSAVYTAKYTACTWSSTRSCTPLCTCVHGRLWAVYTRVHSRLRAVYTAVTKPCTCLNVAVYTARVQPCTGRVRVCTAGRVCTRHVSRPYRPMYTARVHGHVHGPYTTVYTAVHGPCTLNNN